MDKHSPNFSMQDAMRVANTDAGKQLLELLQANNGDALKQAMNQANSGDYSSLSKTLAPILASEDVQKLLKQLGGK